jgi:hypothetical protein
MCTQLCVRRCIGVHISNALVNCLRMCYAYRPRAHEHLLPVRVLAHNLRTSTVWLVFTYPNDNELYVFFLI